MLKDGRVATRLPAQDLQRARAFYAEKLGLEPSEERPGGLLYRCAERRSSRCSSPRARRRGRSRRWAGRSTISAATVAELRRRGVVFEEVDVPGLKTVDGIADVAGNYPSKGSGERAAWFRDSEGNMLGIGQPIP